MYNVPALEEVRLYLRTGEVFTYKSKREALKDLGLRWIEENVGEHFCVYSHTERLVGDYEVANQVYRTANAIMRDPHGNPLFPGDFRALCPKKKRYRWWLRYETWNGEGPVPGTGRRPGGRYCRRVQTTSERRLAQVIDPVEPKPRAARNVSNIPKIWDDYTVAAREDRSWKRFRRTQYKTPKR